LQACNPSAESDGYTAEWGWVNPALSFLLSARKRKTQFQELVVFHKLWDVNKISENGGRFEHTLSALTSRGLDDLYWMFMAAVSPRFRRTRCSLHLAVEALLIQGLVSLLQGQKYIRG